jgi:soluble lytic murein transglycosylase-like protein
MRFCFILLLTMPTFAASAPPVSATSHAKTVVRVDVKSGKLIRAVVAPPAAAIAPKQLSDMVDRIAKQGGVEAPLVHSVIQAESNYNPSAVSTKGAQGIMQLIPATARRFGVTDVFDPEENIEGGVKYLRFLLDYYRGDYTRAIAAYNAGEGAVDKYNGVPPYAETQGYVRNVAKNLTAQRTREAAASTRSAQPATAEARPHIQARIGTDGLRYYETTP